MKKFRWLVAMLCLTIASVSVAMPQTEEDAFVLGLKNNTNTTLTLDHATVANSASQFLFTATVVPPGKTIYIFGSTDMTADLKGNLVFKSSEGKTEALSVIDPQQSRHVGATVWLLSTDMIGHLESEQVNYRIGENNLYLSSAILSISKKTS